MSSVFETKQHGSPRTEPWGTLQSTEKLGVCELVRSVRYNTNGTAENWSYASHRLASWSSLIIWQCQSSEGTVDSHNDVNLCVYNCMLYNCLEWYKWVLTNLYHARQLYNTLIPPSRESPAVGLRISRLSGSVELTLRYTTPDIHCRHRRHECDCGISDHRHLDCMQFYSYYSITAASATVTGFSLSNSD